MDDESLGILESVFSCVPSFWKLYHCDTQYHVVIHIWLAIICYFCSYNVMFCACVCDCVCDFGMLLAIVEFF